MILRGWARPVPPGQRLTRDTLPFGELLHLAALAFLAPGSRALPALLRGELLDVIGAPAFMDAQPVMSECAARDWSVTMQDRPAVPPPRPVALGAEAHQLTAGELRCDRFNRVDPSRRHSREEGGERVTGHLTLPGNSRGVLSRVRRWHRP